MPDKVDEKQNRREMREEICARDVLLLSNNHHDHPPSIEGTYTSSQDSTSLRTGSRVGFPRAKQAEERGLSPCTPLGSLFAG